MRVSSTAQLCLFEPRPSGENPPPVGDDVAVERFELIDPSHPAAYVFCGLCCTNHKAATWPAGTPCPTCGDRWPSS